MHTRLVRNVPATCQKRRPQSPVVRSSRGPTIDRDLNPFTCADDPVVSDGDLARQIELACFDAAQCALLGVHVAVHYGVVTLRGVVDSWYLKQIAQMAAGKVNGVDRIVNEIRVISPCGDVLAD